MTLSARERVAAVLDRQFGRTACAATALAEPAILDLGVAGLGDIALPVTPAKAKKLRELAAPAKYGKGTETLTDTSVRDTWEVPRESVHVRWGRDFEAVLASIRDDLGLPPTCTLRPELHSMLVYERGQFFLPHQDSEKHDGMVATLVVVLPHRHTGGELLIGSGKERVEVRGDERKLVFAAFYADTRHEVKQVRTGTRICLTFNLVLEGGTRPRETGSQSAMDEIARHLREHFATSVPRSPYSRESATPDRLVYFLAHQYTERGLDWDRLKGEDAMVAGLLGDAAQLAGCRTMLALTEVHETWDAYPEREYRHHSRHDEFEDDDEEDPDSGPYELNDLIDGETRLVHWIDEETGVGEDIELDVSDIEICTAPDHAMHEPYEQSYEGYMGNWGNTLDRWYRRVALVVFPAEREFAIRTEASTQWALERITEQAEQGDADGARARVRELKPWITSSPQELGAALTAALAVDDAASATLLLDQVHTSQLRAETAPQLAALADKYRVGWAEKILGVWGARRADAFSFYSTDDSAWYQELPEQCAILHAAGPGARAAAVMLTQQAWQSLLAAARTHSRPWPTRHQTQALESLAPRLSRLLAAIEACHAGSTREEIARTLPKLDDGLTVWLHAATRVGGAGSDIVAAETARRLRTRLARPRRAPDDWSIPAPAGCGCELCARLDAFLADRERRVLEWPIVTASRSHIHGRIDSAELPVSHVTRRQGRPYTLVLTKQDTLFTREREQRERDEADLAALGHAGT
jgi:2-oxoglutarate-Fe(II)-dependent oxygenase superfamily protein